VNLIIKRRALAFLYTLLIYPIFNEYKKTSLKAGFYLNIRWQSIIPNGLFIQPKYLLLFL